MLKIPNITSVVLKDGEVIMVKGDASLFFDGFDRDNEKFIDMSFCTKVNRIITTDDDEKSYTITYKEGNELRMEFLKTSEIAAVYDGDYELARLLNNRLHQQL